LPDAAARERERAAVTDIERAAGIVRLRGEPHIGLDLRIEVANRHMLIVVAVVGKGRIGEISGRKRAFRNRDIVAFQGAIRIVHAVNRVVHVAVM